jgi:E3 ubiquitin-protein ligase HERC2
MVTAMKTSNLTLLCFLTGSDPSAISAGHRFMTDLLVSSLMADGGLETALKAAFKGQMVTVLICNVF